jgi:hypothetical protein
MTTTTTSRTMNLARRTSVLRFAAGDVRPPDGEYCCRGGICWPVIVDREGGRMEGFALMAGRHVKTGGTYILAQTPFVCIDHVQDSAGVIQYRGLSTWFVDAWAMWYADAYCWRQPWETNRRYLRQVLESAMIQPKPHLIELDWDRDEDARVIVEEAEATGRLVYELDSPLHQSILAYSVADPSARDQFPAVQALTCALHGLESGTPKERV